MTTPADSADLLAALIACEEQNGLFERSLLGVRYWHLVRDDLFRETLQTLGLGERGHLRVEELPRARMLKAAAAQLPATIDRSLWTGLEPADLLVANHPRHLPDAGRFVCPYSQPLLDALPYSRLVLEGHFQGSYFHPSAEENIRYVDLPLILAHASFRVRELAGRGFGAGELGQIRELKALLERSLGAAPALSAVLRRVRTAVLATLGLAPRYERLLDRVRPKLVVEVIGYRLVHMILTRVARGRAIPVAELQHGTIGAKHAAYNFAPGRMPDAFPDHLLLFGQLWREITPGIPLPPERTPAIGYAWLEQHRDAQARTAPRAPKRVLFISQGTIGRELSRIAVALRAGAATDALHIVYRLHPSEANAWRERYPELAASSISVETSASRSLYAAQADADVQVGVYSTALLEGVAFGLPTFIVELPGHEHFAAFVARGMLTQVRDASALVDALARTSEPLPRAQINALWSPDPIGAFRAFVERVL